MKPLLVVLFLCISINAQSVSSTKSTDQAERVLLFSLELRKTELEAEAYALDPANNRDKADSAKKVLAMYAQAVREPVLLEAVISNIARDYAGMKEKAGSAPQASQVAEETNVRLQFIIIQQNARIITLLEQISRRR